MLAAVHQEEHVPKTLRIAENLSLPIKVVTEKVGVLGSTGSGKTTTASVLVEQLLLANLPVDIIDPTDAWWGLKSSKDGKREGFPVTVLGGDHGDAPLEETAGAVIADLIAETAPPLVISTSHFTKSAMRRFLADFAERLYQKNRRALHVVWDEIDEAAPQNPMKMKGGGERLFGAVDQIVRRGRLRGLGVTMISQRSAELAKSILSQCSVLIAHRASHPSDIEPVLDWMKHHAKDRLGEVSKTIAGLANGEAWVMSAEFLHVFDRYQILDRTTFNSSATPEPGVEAIVPKRLAKPDLALLQEKMRDTIERAKANDPAALRRKVAELERELERKPAAAPPAPPKVQRVEVQVLKDGQVKRLEAAVERLATAQDRLAQAQQVVATEAGLLREAIVRARGAPPPAAPRTAAPIPPARRQIAPAAAPRATPAPPPADGEPLGKGERIVLTAVAQHPGGVTREQLTVLTGYKRSTRDAYVQRLRGRNLVADGERITATDVGLAELGPEFEPLPTGAALLEHWRRRLPPGELACLEVAVAAYPDGVDRDRISETTTYQRSSRDAYLQRLRARQLITEPARGQVRASEVLFG